MDKINTTLETHKNKAILAIITVLLMLITAACNEPINTGGKQLPVYGISGQPVTAIIPYETDAVTLGEPMTIDTGVEIPLVEPTPIDSFVSNTES